MTQNPGTTPWGYQGTFRRHAGQSLWYWEKPYWYGSAGTNPAGAQQRYAYKQCNRFRGRPFWSLITSDHVSYGTIGGLCTPCHDPHGVSPTLGTNQAYGVPLLKGTWMTSPYKEDVAPVSATEPRGGGKEAAVLNVGSTPLYHIDQNTFDVATASPRQGGGGGGYGGSTTSVTAFTWNFTSTKRVTETVDQFGGLCLKCHPKSSIAPTTGTQSSPAPWRSVDRIHNSVQGWGTYGANAGNAVHSYTCSKCHTPHNSCLNRLLITNCLDFSHRGQVASGGVQPIKNTERGEEGSGAGNFPGGGGGGGSSPKYPGPWFWGSASGSHGGGDGGYRTSSSTTTTRACHDNTNTDAYPSNERWNVKSPWGIPGPPPPPSSSRSGGGD